MLRDRFVFDLLDDSLKERLLHESDLNLVKAIEIAQQQESLKQQIKYIATKPPSGVNALTCKKLFKASGTLINCGYCGKWHKPKEFPAYGKKCNLCQKPNHFAKMCRTRQPQKPAKQIQSSHKTSRRLDAFEETEKTSSDLKVLPHYL